MNAFGDRLRIQIFGESHGVGVGCIVDGVPAGMPYDGDAIQAALDARRPGTGPLVSQRNEPDTVEVLSGVHEGRCTGAPLTLFVRNHDTRSKDYSEVARKPRPGHADWVAHVWAHGHHDPRGGGHYSGRLTAPLVAAGAMLRPLLAAAGITTGAHVHAVHDLVGPADAHDAATLAARAIASPVHTAHTDLEAAFIDRIEAARNDKDSVGGLIEFKADGVPVALGDPFFDSVESRLAHLLFSVPAVKGVSFGSGFSAAAMKGSEHNDPYTVEAGSVRSTTNHAGGILGGRTSGAPVWGHVAIKPTASIFRPQDTVDLETGQPATLELKGRHDPCIAVRAAPVVHACLDLVLADLLLLGMQQGHAEVPSWD